MMQPKILTYLPHGEIPDARGFAPALVAQNLAKKLVGFKNLHVCAAETLLIGFERNPEWGDIQRIRESRLYRRLFRKLTKLDPYPLHRRLARIANRFEPDIVHIHQLEFPADEFRRLLKKPAKIIIHGHTVRAYESGFGEAELYLAASQYIADRLVAGGYPKEKMSVFPNGIDAEKFTPLDPDAKNSLRAELNITSTSPVLLFFGRKQEVKGFDLFLQTVDSLRATVPGLVAIAIGPTPKNTIDDSGYKRNRDLQHALVYAGVLRDIGPLPHSEIARYLQAADVAILPSRDEPQGMAMIEAMAAGLIVVSGNVGGIKESIRHGVDGFLVDTNSNSNEVLGIVLTILDDFESYRQIGSKAHESTSIRFDWRNLTPKLAELYRRLLS